MNSSPDTATKFLICVALVFCAPSFVFGQLSDIPWKAAEQIRNGGSNKVEYNEEGFVTRILIEDMPSGFVMGQLEVFPQLESVAIDSRYYFEDSNMGGIRKLKKMKEFKIKDSRYASTALLELLAEVLRIALKEL